MPIKKSAILLIVLSLSSVCLLVFSSSVTPSLPYIPDLPAVCTPAKSCTNMIEPKSDASWDMISQIMLRSAA
ncbi:MAG: hypothetical protein ABIS69_05645 [Sediminibacterium sp.]